MHGLLAGSESFPTGTAHQRYGDLVAAPRDSEAPLRRVDRLDAVVQPFSVDPST